MSAVCRNFTSLNKAEYIYLKNVAWKNRFSNSILVLNLLLIIFFQVFLLSSVFAFTPQPGSPLANGSHPRLHITQESIPGIRNALANYYQAEFQEYVNWAAATDDNNKNNVISGARHDLIRALMVHQAFIAAIGIVPNINYPIPLETYARRAINRLLDQLNSGAKLSYVAAITYDWTFQYMTDSERSQIANLMLDRQINHKVFNHSIANPQITPQQMFSSKYYEGCYAWYIALALWGDGYIDAQADQAVDTFYDVMLNYGYLDAQNFVAGQDGGWSEWIGYSSWHPRSHILLVDGWRTATDEDYILQNTLNGNAIKNYPQFMAYAMDPHKYFNDTYTYVRMGGAQTTDASLEHRSMREQMYVLPRLLQESGLTNEAGLMSYLIETYDVRWPSAPFFYLWGFLGLQRSITPISPEDLNFPKSRWFKNLGVFLARTGFNSDADGVFGVTSSHYNYAGHAGPDDFPGFNIIKFGTLVNTRYVAHRGYGNLGKYPGAFRYNTIMFEGDHRDTLNIVEDPPQLEDVISGKSNYDYGGIEQVTRKDGIFYHVRGNYERSFRDGVTFTREYVWLPGTNPSEDSDFLVIYDRTFSPTKPHWIYHVPWKPFVSNYVSSEDITTGSSESDRIGTAYNGSEIVVKELNSLGGEQDNDKGTLSYVGGGVAHGVVFSRTILPVDIRVEISRVAKFDKDVLNRQDNLAIKSHRWQVDVIPSEIKAENKFLHVFQAADENKRTQMVATKLVEASNKMQGVWIEKEVPNRPNFLVLFNKEHAIMDSAFSYTLSGNGLVRHVIVGLKPNTVYQIQDVSSAGTLTSLKVTEQDMELWNYRDQGTNLAVGVLYFESVLNGQHTFVISTSDDQGFITPGKPKGIKIER